MGGGLTGVGTAGCGGCNGGRIFGDIIGAGRAGGSFAAGVCAVGSTGGIIGFTGGAGIIGGVEDLREGVVGGRTDDAPCCAGVGRGAVERGYEMGFRGGIGAMGADVGDS